MAVEIGAEVEQEADTAWLWLGRGSTSARGCTSGGQPTFVAAGGWDPTIISSPGPNPPRPKWMDEQTYASIPDTLTLREMRYCVARPGYRVQVLTVVTTLLDAEVDSRQDIAQLYGFRWNSELDIRSIKQSLNLAHVRCKSPEMAHRELWTTLLGYNLIRTPAAAAAALHKKQPRQIGFTAACQYVLASWSLFSRERPASQVLSDCRALLAHIAQCEVANRPGRIEPRQLKRRRHGYKLMQEPRETLRSRMKHN